MATVKIPAHTKVIRPAAAVLGLLFAGLCHGQTPGQFPPDRPPINGPLTGIPVPVPDLTGFVVDKQAAIALGKALFWDQQTGSDGLACGSCHFHAGADNRVKNQIDPGLRNTNPALQSIFNPMGSGKKGPNNTLSKLDYPFHKLADITDRNSTVLFDTNDITSSQGVFRGDFSNVNLLAPAKRAEVCAAALDPTFSVGGINVRQVEPRNTPTMINAIFNFRNFWDGRANNIFNGRNPFGPRDTSAGSNPVNSVMVSDAQGNMTPFPVAIPDASLASQAVGPLNSNLEMSCNGKLLEAIGQKLLRRNPSTLAAITVPLSGQTVAPTDSVLGAYAGGPGKGLTIGYETLIKRAFDQKFWSAPGLTVDGYRQIEKNFSMFWGLSIMLYESTLVSNDAPFDRYMNGDITAMTTQQVNGFLQVFVGKGGCNFCHAGPEFTGAASELKKLQTQGAQVEHMFMGDGTVGLYDSGFYNIGVRPPGDDIGAGGTDPFNNPLTWTRQLKNVLTPGNTASTILNIGPDGFNVNTCNFLALACVPVAPDARDAVDGSFKVPTLRNVELTGPYFHNGGQATLEQVVAFYNRGGDGAGTEAINTTGFGINPTNRAPAILPSLGLTADDQANVVAFLKALTDERVRWEKAPFDHPSIAVPNGHTFDQNSVLRNGATGYAVDSMMTIPAVGAAGRAAAGLPALTAFDAGLR
jgi:cytochrome c peroxidase